MKRRALLGIIAASALAAGLGSCGILFHMGCTGQMAPADVILIVADDAGWADFGFHGSTEVSTPNLDRLGAQGTRFTQAYVSASVCSPSRAGLLTGRYQQRFGHEFNIGPADAGLPLSERTLADRLRAEGYRTVAVGKWHLGAEDRFHPLARGFDEFIGLRGGSRSYFPYEPGKGGPQRRLEGTGKEAEDFAYLTDFLTEAAVEAIEGAGEEPLFLYLSYTAPHTPMHGRPDLEEALTAVQPAGRRRYVAMMAALDEGVGRVLAAVEARERDFDAGRPALVVFLNDNGGATNNHSDNGHLRGMKGSKWEGGIRVPMLIRWPRGSSAREATYDRPVSALDIAPTALAHASGFPWEEVDGFDGVNLHPFVGDPEAPAPHERLYWRRGPAAAVRSGDWKLIRVEGQEHPLLFDLATDPGETVDRSAEQPELVRELGRALRRWERGMVEPRWDTGEVWRENQRRKHRMDVVGRAAEREFP